MCRVLTIGPPGNSQEFFFFDSAGSSLLPGLFSSCSELGLISSYSVQASHCSGLSYCRTQALGHVGLSSCGSQAPEQAL